MADLTDAQLVILSTAAQRADGALLPVPKTFAKNEATVARVLKSLVKRGLAAEQSAKANCATVWRTDKAGQRFTLVLTAAGRQAIGVEEDQPTLAAPKKAAAPHGKPGRPATAGAKPGTKLGLLTDLLRRKGGTTIAEAVKATGWQAHSVRGAISGAIKKKLGLMVASTVVEGRGRVYRIAH